jgi:predicted small lipoprotein YifL
MLREFAAILCGALSVRRAALATVVLALAACGVKGPLRLPPPPSVTPPAGVSAAPGAPSEPGASPALAPESASRDGAERKP